MPVSKSKVEANHRYQKKTYEQIAFIVRYDAEINGDAIRAHAAAMGESMNGFLKRAVQEAMERDKKQDMAG